MVERAGSHNLVCLVLAVAGALMLAVAYLDWVDHSMTLWVGQP